MLKKIENIASTAEFKNSTRYTAGVHSLPVITGGKSGDSDSLSFSSAFQYLSHLKWQLKSLEHTDNDEFVIEFVVDNLTFKTKVSTHDCNSSDIKYNISNENVLSPPQHKYQILISFDFDPKVYNEDILASSAEYLNWLFEKFASYDSLLLKSSISPEVNSFIIDGAENNLKYELSLIHKNLIFFVEKVTDQVLSSNLRRVPYNTGTEKSIKILYINVKL